MKISVNQKKTMISILIGIIALIIVIAIFSSWNDIWYNLGGHVYNWLHK